jgi:hypothetical protein
MCPEEDTKAEASKNVGDIQQGGDQTVEGG